MGIYIFVKAKRKDQKKHIPSVVFGVALLRRNPGPQFWKNMTKHKNQDILNSVGLSV